MQSTHPYNYANKNLFWMRLIVWQHQETVITFFRIDLKQKSFDQFNASLLYKSNLQKLLLTPNFSTVV